MTVYLVNMCLILFWGYIFLYKFKSDTNKKIYCSIIAFQWILISGLRHIDIGADTDSYLIKFKNIKRISWPEIFSNITDYLFRGKEVKDPGYDLFQKAVQVFSSNYRFLLIVIAIIFTSIMVIWIYKNSKLPCFSFILYSTLFYSFFSVTGHRQTLATAVIVFWGYKYIKERKLIKFLIVSFIAFLLHKSSLVVIPFYFIANIPITLPYVIIALIVVAVVAISGKNLYGVVGGFLGFSEEQIEYDVGGAETYALILTLVSIIILLFYHYYKNNTDKARHIFNITLLTLMTSLLVFQNQSFMRIQQYYSLFLMISFPEVILSFNKKERALAYGFTITVLIVYLMYNNPQYYFFWQ